MWTQSIHHRQQYSLMWYDVMQFDRQVVICQTTRNNVPEYPNFDTVVRTSGTVVQYLYPKKRSKMFHIFKSYFQATPLRPIFWRLLLSCMKIFPFTFPGQISFSLYRFSHACCMPCASCLACFHDLIRNLTLWRVKFIKLHSMQLSSASCYFLSFRSIYSHTIAQVWRHHSPF